VSFKVQIHGRSNYCRSQWHRKAYNLQGDTVWIHWNIDVIWNNIITRRYYLWTSQHFWQILSRETVGQIIRIFAWRSHMSRSYCNTWVTTYSNITPRLWAEIWLIEQDLRSAASLRLVMSEAFALLLVYQVNNYPSPLRDVTVARGPQLDRGGSLKSCVVMSAPGQI